MDGTTVDARNPLGDLVSAKKVGDTVTLSVTSWGQETAHDVKVTLEKNPAKDAPFLGVQYASAPPRFGGDGMPRTRDDGGCVRRGRHGGRPGGKGGHPGARRASSRWTAQQVTNPQQVVDAVGKHKPGDTLALTVFHRADGKQTDITVTLGQNPKDAAKAWLGLSMSDSLPGMREGCAASPARRPQRQGRTRRHSEKRKQAGVFQSIRWRLAASYALLILLSVTLMGALALSIVQGYVGRQESAYLRANAREIADLAQRFLEPHGAPGGPRGACLDLGVSRRRPRPHPGPRRAR